MRILLPDIPEAERTPLVRQLLDIIALQQERIQQLEERVHQLEDEIARLKGLKTRPRIAPSSLDTPPRPPRDPNAKRPGSAKRSKTAQLTITEETVLRLPHVPEGAVFKGYEDFVVQDLILQPRVSATAANAGGLARVKTWWPRSPPTWCPAATTDRT